MATRITVNNYVSMNKGIAPAEGLPIFNDIITAFNAGDSVVLDFQGIDMMTTAFLNVVIGGLYQNYNTDQLVNMLSFEHITDATAVRIKTVTDNAKLFYRNQDKFGQSIEEVLHGGH